MQLEACRPCSVCETCLCLHQAVQLMWPIGREGGVGGAYGRGLRSCRWANGRLKFARELCAWNLRSMLERWNLALGEVGGLVLVVGARTARSGCFGACGMRGKC